MKTPNTSGPSDGAPQLVQQFTVEIIQGSIALVIFIVVAVGLFAVIRQRLR